MTQWAIINGEREFGVTLHYVDDGVDTGPVIAERRFALDDTDDAQSVAGKLREAGSELLTTWWPRLIDGTAPRIPQDESRAKYWPLRTPEEGRVTWEMSAPAICRLVRALSANSPGAYVDVRGRRIRLRRTAVMPPLNRHAQPGEVVAVYADTIRVAAAGGDVTHLGSRGPGGPRARTDDPRGVVRTCRRLSRSQSSTMATVVSAPVRCALFSGSIVATSCSRMIHTHRSLSPAGFLCWLGPISITPCSQ